MPLSPAGKAVAAVVAIGSLGAYGLARPHARGETVFLERLAIRVDGARVIAPETAARISDLLVRARDQNARGADLEGRRQQAIARIEGALQTKRSFGGAQGGTQFSPVARR